MDKGRIEKKAKHLRRQIYVRRAECWPDREPHPFEMIDPEIAAKILGIDFQYEQELQFNFPGVKYETAGILDRPRRTIVVATKFGPQVTRYTAAHEIGHWLLHPLDCVQHRDRPIKGIERDVRDPMEKEADYFAAVFLMPSHFIRKVFRLRFLADTPFVFDENSIHRLHRYNDMESLLYPDRDSLDRERALASAKWFGESRFEKSLAEMFHVSVETMAIRIKELGLVRAWP